MKPNLIQQQTLQWKMNQTLLQSIHILQLSSIELTDYINEVVKENPLIEEVNYDYDIQQYRKSHSEDVSIDINRKEETMYDKLKFQLSGVKVPKELKPVVEYGIDSLNDDGYLDIDLETWAEDCRTTVPMAEKALSYIQSLEPTGIGARNLSECISLQLKEMGKDYPFVMDLMEHHLEWVATENVEEIAGYYETTEEIAAEVIDSIKLCHPKPGLLLNTQQPEYIIPEAMIFKENGSWKIKFYKWANPTIKISDMYHNLMGMEKEADSFLKEKFRQVEWLKQAIHYRTNTLEDIITLIVEKQYDYFEHGIMMMKALTLSDIADELDLHVSTISRAINQKYVQTPKGVFPIKYFLPSGVRQKNGKKTASNVIKYLIQEMIDMENKRKPLSDQAIKERLLDEYDIDIARRTVMKYREQLYIPASTKRRKR